VKYFNILFNFIVASFHHFVQFHQLRRFCVIIGPDTAIGTQEPLQCARLKNMFICEVLLGV
jgi:hypothetical protein